MQRPRVTAITSAHCWMHVHGYSHIGRLGSCRTSAAGKSQNSCSVQSSRTTTGLLSASVFAVLFSTSDAELRHPRGNSVVNVAKICSVCKAYNQKKTQQSYNTLFYFYCPVFNTNRPTEWSKKAVPRF